MISPGIRKIAKRFNLEQAGHYCAGTYRNCFLLVYAGLDMKVAKITFPAITENDKLAIRNILSKYDFISAHWIYAKLILQFSERIGYYPIRDIIGIIASVVDYSVSLYPGLVPVCVICNTEKKARVYYTKFQVVYVCDSCRPKVSRMKKKITDEKGSKEKCFLSGLLGAVAFSFFGILTSLLCYVLFSDFAILAAAGYFTFARRGYEKYHGNLTLFGVCIVFIVGLASTACGFGFSYIFLSALQSSGFSTPWGILTTEKEYQHLSVMFILSMLTYLLFSSFSICRSVFYLVPRNLKLALPIK